MSKQTNRQTTRGAPNDADADADAYSIAAFCKRHGISESFFFKLKSQGLGPRVMRIGSRVLITREAASEWRQQRDAVKAE